MSDEPHLLGPDGEPLPPTPEPDFDAEAFRRAWEFDMRHVYRGQIYWDPEAKFAAMARDSRQRLGELIRDTIKIAPDANLFATNDFRLFDEVWDHTIETGQG